MIPTMCGGSMIPTFVTEEIGIACKTVLTCDDALGVVCESQTTCGKPDVPCVEESSETLPYLNCGEDALHIPPCVATKKEPKVLFENIELTILRGTTHEETPAYASMPSAMPIIQAVPAGTPIKLTVKYVTNGTSVTREYIGQKNECTSDTVEGTTYVSCELAGEDEDGFGHLDAFSPDYVYEGKSYDLRFNSEYIYFNLGEGTKVYVTAEEI